MAYLKEKNIIESLLINGSSFIYDTISLCEEEPQYINFFNELAQFDSSRSFYGIPFQKKQNKQLSVFSENFNNLKEIQKINLNNGQENAEIIELNDFLIQYCQENMNHSNSIKSYCKNNELSLPNLFKQTGIFEKLMFYLSDKGLDLEHNNAYPLKQLISLFDYRITFETNHGEQKEILRYDMAMFFDYYGEQVGWDHLLMTYPDLIKTTVEQDSLKAFDFLKDKGFDSSYIDKNGYSLAFYAQSTTMLEYLLKDKNILVQNTQNPNISLIKLVDLVDDKTKKNQYYKMINKELNNRDYDKTKINNDNINVLLETIYSPKSNRKEEFNFLYKNASLNHVNQQLTYNNTKTNLLGHVLNYLSEKRKEKHETYYQTKISKMMRSCINSQFSIINQLINNGSDIFTTIQKHDQPDISLIATYFNIVNESGVQGSRKAQEQIELFEKALFHENRYSDVNQILTQEQFENDINYSLFQNDNKHKGFKNFDKVFQLYSIYSQIGKENILDSSTTKFVDYVKNSHDIFTIYTQNIDDSFFVESLINSNRIDLKANFTSCISKKTMNENFVSKEIINTMVKIADSIKERNIMDHNLDIQQSKSWVKLINSSITSLMKNNDVMKKSYNSLKQASDQLSNLELKLGTVNQNNSQIKKKQKPVL